MTVDMFASVRDGYTLETITFNFDELTPKGFRHFDTPPNQVGVFVLAHCPHDRQFRAFIPLSKEMLNDSNFFSEMMRLIDFGSGIAMENGCDNHDKKGNQ